MSAVIFDLDGVLVDTEPYWRTAYAEVINAAAAEFGWPNPGLAPDGLCDYVGGRVDETLQDVLIEIGQFDASNRDVLQLLADRVIESVSIAFVSRPTPIEESVRALRELHTRGVTIAVASSSALRFIDIVLESIGLSNLVRTRASAFELPYGKPDPEVYLRTLDALDERAIDCLAIEDSAPGIGAAVRAGIPCIGLWRGAGARPAAFEKCIWVTSSLDADAIEARLPQ